MRDYPNIRHIRLIDAAVRLGSLSRAADAVGISQPAASQALARLERLFGGKLLERDGAGAKATPRGAVVARRSKRALSLLKSGHARLARLAKGGSRAADLAEPQTSMTHLRALSAFAETGSFSAASRRLGLTEPSVQRAARELEQIAAVALFDGAGRHLVLSPAGRLLGRHAHLVLKEIDAAWDEIRELEGAYDGRVMVATLPLVRTRIIPTAVVALTEKRPQADIEIVDGPYDTLVQDLANGRVDMLVGALREDLPRRDLAQEPLFTDDLSVVARAGHPLARKRLTPAMLGRFPWVLPREGTPSRTMFERLAKGFDAGWNGVGIVETGSLVALRGILMQSDRLTILSRRQILFEEEAGFLTVLPFRLYETGRPIGITTRADWEPTALQADFLSALRHAVAEEGGGSRGRKGGRDG
ncbi:LysR family transcriptional regulator [Amorphus coralli]|uniref:LysR family transcriptional regulator n=1 Tax=Amorphus coralli TaxID=340680 RepID=UPI0003655D7D|nr:LysR family transcriptional regulator [Amorphus coralli]